MNGETASGQAAGTEKRPLPCFSLAALAVLLLLTPWVMRFEPVTHSGIGRSVFVFLGLTGAVLALTEFLYALADPEKQWLESYLAAFLACAVLGWRNFPYWVNGVHAARAGTVPFVDLDPKGLEPMVWIGELWRLGVGGVCVLYIVSTPILIGTVALLARRRRFATAGLIAILILIASTFMFSFTPEYGTWIFD